MGSKQVMPGAFVRRAPRRERLNCRKPDHDVPALTCGQPLPCPFHTVLIDTEPSPPTITEPVTAGLSPLERARLREVANAIGDGDGK